MKSQAKETISSIVEDIKTSIDGMTDQDSYEEASTIVEDAFIDGKIDQSLADVFQSVIDHASDADIMIQKIESSDFMKEAIAAFIEDQQ